MEVMLSYKEKLHKRGKMNKCDSCKELSALMKGAYGKLRYLQGDSVLGWYEEIFRIQFLLVIKISECGNCDLGSSLLSFIPRGKHTKNF